MTKAAERTLPTLVIRPTEYEIAMNRALTARQCEKVHQAIQETRESYYTLIAYLKEHGEATEADVCRLLRLDADSPEAAEVISDVVAVAATLGPQPTVRWCTLENTIYYSIED